MHSVTNAVHNNFGTGLSIRWNEIQQRRLQTQAGSAGNLYAPDFRIVKRIVLDETYEQALDMINEDRLAPRPGGGYTPDFTPNLAAIPPDKAYQLYGRCIWPGQMAVNNLTQGTNNTSIHNTSLPLSGNALKLQKYLISWWDSSKQSRVIDIFAMHSDDKNTNLTIESAWNRIIHYRSPSDNWGHLIFGDFNAYNAWLNGDNTGSPSDPF